MNDGTEQLEKLLERIAQRDQDALGELAEILHPKLLSAAHAVIPKLGLAEDAVQETYIVVWCKAHKYNPTLGSPSAWINGILRKNIKRLLKNTKILKELPLDENVIGFWREPDFAVEGAFELLTRDEQFVMYCKANKIKYKKIAKRTGWSIDKVTNLARDAKAKIKSFLDD